MFKEIFAMDEEQKSKALLRLFFASLGLVMLAAFLRIVVFKAYAIEGEIKCDPATEKCFVRHCDPATEECTGNALDDTSYYKLGRRSAGKIPLCSPETDETCQPFACEKTEKGCEQIFCDEQTKQQGEECNDPAQYVLDNPAGATEENCDPAVDEACQQTEGSVEPQDANADQASSEPAPIEPTPASE